MDKQTSKKIDEAVSHIRISLYEATLAITDEIQREIERRLIQTIHDRWEYMDKNKKKGMILTDIWCVIYAMCAMYSEFKLRL